MKTISCVFLVLLLVSFVSASTPDFNITFVDEPDLVNGRNDAGAWLFTELSYIPDYFNLTTTDFFNAQQHDILRWQGALTAVIRSPNNQQQILTTGTQYVFTQTGQHTLYFLNNESIFSYIAVDTEDPININIEEYDIPNGFDISLSDDSFTLNNEKVIDIDIDVDKNVAPKTYKLVFEVNNEQYNRSYKVIQNNNWVIYNNTLPTSVEAKNGDSKLLGYMLLRNDGNIDTQISVKKTGGDAYLLGVPQPQTLFKSSILRINYQLQVPSTQKPKDYPIDIEVIGGNITKKFKLNISVVDSINPVIEQINFSTDRIFRENEISVIATDNNKVSNVTLTFDGKTIVLDKDQQKFTTTINFTRLSRYEMKFCAVDEFDNKGCTSVNKTFVKTELINDFEKVVVLPSKKIGTYAEIKLFNITERVEGDVFVQLVSVTPKNFQNINNGSYKVRLMDKDGAIKQFTEFSNQVKLTETGQVTLQMMSNEVSDFDGILRLLLPDYAEEVPDITFKASFKDFDVPEDFSVEWFDNTIDCEVHDTGDLDTSYYECEGLTFPIDVEPSDISIPTSIREREQLDSDIEEKNEQIHKMTSRFVVFVSLSVGLAMISAFLVWFFITQYPYLLWFAKSKDEE